MMVLKIIENRKFIYFTTRILRRIIVLTTLLLLISLFILFIDRSFIPFKIVTLEIIINFSALFPWIIFNMIPSYYEIGELSLSNEEIKSEIEETEKINVIEADKIEVFIHEYKGQSYGPRSFSVFQGNNNYIILSIGNNILKYSFIVKSKNTLAKLTLIVNKWKSDGANVKFVFPEK
jgi:hypothetical protein